MTASRLWTRWRRLPLAERRLMMQALPLTLALPLLLRLISLPRLARWLTVPVASSEGLPAARVVELVASVARHGPIRPNCLVQTLAALPLARRQGHPATACIGVALDDDRAVRAHAWLEVEGQPVGEAASPYDDFRLLYRMPGSAAKHLGHGLPGEGDADAQALTWVGGGQ